MKTTLEDITNLEKQIKVLIPEEQVKEEFLKAYKYLQKNVELKGFRKGKAPLQQIRTIYSDKVKDDVAQNLVQSSYWQALQEHKLTPVSMPSIDFGDLNEEGEFSFSATFEIRPEIKIQKKTDFTIPKEKISITDQKVQDVIDNIRQSHSQLVAVKDERALQNGDFAKIDFEGFIDGAPLENGAAKDHTLEIGSNQFIPGFEEALVGMVTGSEKTVNLSFPEDYHVDNLKAKPVEFKVTLHEIQTKELPEMDKDFLERIQQDSVESLTKQVTDDLESNETKRIETETRENLLKMFVEANPVEVPKSLFEEQRKALVTDFENRLKQQGFTEDNFDEYKKKWDNDFDKTATFMVQSAFLVDQLSEEENLKASDEDLDQKIEEMAKQVGLEAPKVREYYKEQNGLNKLMYQITEDKVYNYLLSNSKIEEFVKTEESAKS